MSPTAHSRLSNAAVPNLKREGCCMDKSIYLGGRILRSLKRSHRHSRRLSEAAHITRQGKDLCLHPFTPVVLLLPLLLDNMKQSISLNLEAESCFLSQVLYTGERIESPPPRLVLPLDGLYKGSTHTHSRNQRVGESDLRRMEKKKKGRPEPSIYTGEKLKRLYQAVSMHKSCPE